ncbi:MAG: hypothetical protein Q9170_003059 [Blastenia crenularia]
MSSPATSRDTAVANGPASDKSKLKEHLIVFSGDSLSQDSEGTRHDGGGRLAAGHTIRQLLLDQPGTQDLFRHLKGFEALLQTLDSLVKLFESDEVNEDLLRDWHYLLRIIFNILAAALGDHKGNRTYFKERLAGGGWDSLYQKLKSIRHSIFDSGLESSCTPEQHIFGCLFACAIEDETPFELFNDAQLEEAAKQSTYDYSQRLDGRVSNTLTTHEDRGTSCKAYLEKRLGTDPSLRNPEAILVAFQLWFSSQDFAQSSRPLRGAILVQITLYIARSSTHNLVALHQTSLLSLLISFIVVHSSTKTYGAGFDELAALLLNLGITRLEDARLIYLYARTSSTVARLLQYALESSHLPSYFHFDLSSCGYSSIELPDLGVLFPPTGSSNGFTLSLWFQINRFDGNAHTTLFGAFDSSQTCFVLVYLEKDSHHLILQTSVTSSRPSVRFKSISFCEGRWYHIAIVHQKPKTTLSSRVSLFVNGGFVEQLKANYPLPSPISKAKAGNIEHDLNNTKVNPVQAFVGTPQDLASRLGKGVISTQWRMASIYLFSDVLSDDLIAVHYELGPRYFGNYQDCLGSFNTYQAAASLKLRNDSLYPGKEQRSDIILAMESGGSELLSERKIVLGLSTAYVISASRLITNDESGDVRFMSRVATKAARQLSLKGHESLVVNSAIPTINNALGHAYGSAMLTGDPAIQAINALDNAAWQIGGFTAIVLDQLDKATDPDSILCTLDCIFDGLRDNWRCSEAMEKENGFAVLASLIAQKIDAGARAAQEEDINPSDRQAGKEAKANLALKVLTMVLKFLGFRPDKPEHSVLNNPLAYRVLLVDADCIIKRWLEAVKTDSFRIATFEHFLTAFRSVFAMNMTGDNLRSLAMFITYGFEKAENEDHDRRGQTSLGSTTKNPIQATNADLFTNQPPNEDHLDVELPTHQIATRMLELYADIICQPGEISHMKKFAKTVTNKVHLIGQVI